MDAAAARGLSPPMRPPLPSNAHGAWPRSDRANDGACGTSLLTSGEVPAQLIFGIGAAPFAARPDHLHSSSVACSAVRKHVAEPSSIPQRGQLTLGSTRAPWPFRPRRRWPPRVADRPPSRLSAAHELRTIFGPHHSNEFRLPTVPLTAAALPNAGWLSA